jgi:hypothetical protein
VSNAVTTVPEAGTQARARQQAPGAKLEALLADLPAEGVTLAALRDLVGQDGLLVLVVFLALIFLIPVSIPGSSTAFGAVVLLVGVSRILGRSLWLPQRLARRVFPAERLRSALRHGSRWLRRFERLSRPNRLSCLVGPGPVAVANNAALVLGALLLMSPLAVVPLSNTFPAAALLLLATGLLQRDGVWVLLGHVANLATLAYFVLLVLGGTAAIREAIRRLLALGA